MNNTIRFLAATAAVATNITHHENEDAEPVKIIDKSKLPNYTMSDLGWYDPFYSDDDIDKECELLDNFAIAMQTILGILSFASLLVKRKWELPKRSYRIFMLDISK